MSLLDISIFQILSEYHSCTGRSKPASGSHGKLPDFGALLRCHLPTPRVFLGVQCSEDFLATPRKIDKWNPLESYNVKSALNEHVSSCFYVFSFFGLLAHRKSSDLLGCRYVPVHRKGSWEATEAQPATHSAGKARELEEVYLTLSRYLLNGYVHYAWTYTYYILLYI